MNFDTEQLAAFAASFAARKNQVSSGLNLSLELENPLEMLLVFAAIRVLQNKTDVALKELHFVHFARFLPTRGNTALLVITEFDGDLEPYVMDFAASISEVFSAILIFVKEHPPLPVYKHPQEFWAFIQKNNKVFGGLIDPWPLYSSYPSKTVIDITGPRADLPPPYVDAKVLPIHFADVQGNILRGYHAKFARHFALQILDADKARLFLAATLNGNEVVMPQVTPATDWGSNKPSYFFNMGMTADGLRVLGVTDDTLTLFPSAFQEGPAAKRRAEKNGDFGASAPDQWVLGQPGQPIHLLASLYANDTGVLDAFSAKLRANRTLTAIQEIYTHDAAALPDDRVYFDYKDGMGQPRIAGVTDPAGMPDMQPQAGVGQFLLGTDFTNVYGGASIGNMPVELAQNGSFVAVRILKQDVAGFEKVLAVESARHGIDPELVAAKLVGHWRNGDPLVLQPTKPATFPTPSIAAANSNKFDYAPTVSNPGSVNDFVGNVCPVGAHIRRMNPRAGMVAGIPYSRRIVRRGMPYSKDLPADASNPGAPTTEKGLFGMFMCADLERQFEFLMQTWANGDIAASGIRGTQDPIIGSQSMGGDFRVPVPGSPDRVFKLPRLVETRGSLYLFMPGLSALRRLAGLTTSSTQDERLGFISATGAAPVSSFDPDAFDPIDPAFHADPYPFYALFRKFAPVHFIGKPYNSYWVFSHQLVTEVCQTPDVFYKRPKDEKKDGRGLFFMDPPRHQQIRTMLDPVFSDAIASASQSAITIADQAVLDITAGGMPFELVASFAKRVPRDVFMTMFGIPPNRWSDVDGWGDTILMNRDVALPILRRLKALLANTELQSYMKSLRSGCPAGPAPGLMCMMKERLEPAGMSSDEVASTGHDFGLGGYLSAQFLIATGVYNLLRDGGAAMQQLRANLALIPNAIAEMLRFDAPFQMADRFAAKACTLGGVAIPEGAQVVVVYGSANRDEKVFKDPDTFDITRKRSALNYGFGHGEHYCIGAPLVDIVAPIALGKLLAAFPNLAMADQQLEWLTDPYFRSLVQLRLSY